MRGAQLTDPGTPRRGRGERGAALVEFSIAVSLLLTLLFGIISYGYVLSFKQGLTQAAAEGARAGAVGTPTDAINAVTRSVAAFNKTCNSGGLTCQGTGPGDWSSSGGPHTYACGTHQCIKITVSYDWKNYPLMPKFPGLGFLLPDTLTSTRVAEVS
jgi:Flp pilus assembly protein TadG